MSVTIELKPETERQLEKQAREKGLKIETYIEVLLEENLNGAVKKTGDKPFYESATPDEWISELEKWSESHDRTTPLLSDEATRRESIYEDRY